MSTAHRGQDAATKTDAPAGQPQRGQDAATETDAPAGQPQRGQDAATETDAPAGQPQRGRGRGRWRWRGHGRGHEYGRGREPGRERGRERGRGHGRRTGWVAIGLFLLPALALFVLLVLVPIVLAAYTSVFRWNGLGPPTDFVGLDNYLRLLKDRVFVGDLRRGLILVVLSITVQLPMALGLAMLLNQRLRGRALYRLLFFAPYVLSEVITGVLFTMVFSPQHGLVNGTLGLVGLGDLGTTWLADRSIVLYSVFFVITWKYFGFHMILYLAGRQNIPNELIEAATIDGGSPWQIFRHVTFPLLGPTIRISVFLSVIGAIQLFDLVWVLTGGGPVNASETMAVTMFQTGFRRTQVGYASAISVAMFAVSLVFALGYQRLVMRRDVEGAITGVRGRR